MIKKYHVLIMRHVTNQDCTLILKIILRAINFYLAVVVKICIYGSLSCTPLLPTFLNEKLFQSSFLYTLLEVSQLKTIWFEAENWPGHFTLEARNPFASAQAFPLCFFLSFPLFMF